MTQRAKLQAAERDALAQHELAYQAQQEAERQRGIAEAKALMAMSLAEEARKQAENCK